jgi:DNA-binding GntR family transcriptional regulator
VSPGATFERVYLALKEDLGSGRFRPGDQLEPALLSSELNSSITPVRDALHRLVGERLVQAPRNNGFRAPLLTELALRDLYHWNLQLLILACRGTGAEPAEREHPLPEARADEHGDLAIAAGTLLAAIGRLARSGEHLRAIEAANDRLRPVRLAESRLIGGAGQELEALANAFRGGDFAELRHLLTAYHRVRERRVAELLALMQPSA